jgi:hypothetical protein
MHRSIVALIRTCLLPEAIIMPARHFYLTSWNHWESLMQPQAGAHQQCANSPQQARHTHQNIPGYQKKVPAADEVGTIAR